MVIGANGIKSLPLLSSTSVVQCAPPSSSPFPHPPHRQVFLPDEGHLAVVVYYWHCSSLCQALP